MRLIIALFLWLCFCTVIVFVQRFFLVGGIFKTTSPYRFLSSSSPSLSPLLSLPPPLVFVLMLRWLSCSPLSTVECSGRSISTGGQCVSPLTVIKCYCREGFAFSPAYLFIYLFIYLFSTSSWSMWCLGVSPRFTTIFSLSLSLSLCLSLFLPPAIFHFSVSVSLSGMLLVT